MPFEIWLFRDCSGWPGSDAARTGRHGLPCVAEGVTRTESGLPVTQRSGITRREPRCSREPNGLKSRPQPTILKACRFFNNLQALRDVPVRVLACVDQRLGGFAGPTARGIFTWRNGWRQPRQARFSTFKGRVLGVLRPLPQPPVATRNPEYPQIGAGNKV